MPLSQGLKRESILLLHRKNRCLQYCSTSSWKYEIIISEAGSSRLLEGRSTFRSRLHELHPALLDTIYLSQSRSLVEQSYHRSVDEELVAERFEVRAASTRLGKTGFFQACNERVLVLQHSDGGSPALKRNHPSNGSCLARVFDP